MRTRLSLAVAIVATCGLFLQATDVQAQGRRHCRQGVRSYGQATQYYSYPTNRTVVYSNGMYNAQAYFPSVGYSSGYRSYSYPNQIRYSSGNSYRSGFGYPSIGGLSVGIGVAGYGNRGYRGFGY